jgi:hypothetical protein
VPLIDVLKEAVMRSPCRTTIGAMLGRGDVARGLLLERLLLVLYAYGSNTAIRDPEDQRDHPPALSALPHPDDFFRSK